MTRYTFLGVVYDHNNCSVALAPKFVRKCAAAPLPSHSSVADLEVFISRAFFAAAVLDIPMIHYYFLLKLIRRRLSALNRGLVRLEESAALSPTATRLACDLRQRIVVNSARVLTRVLDTPAMVLATDASMSGWGAVLLPPSGPPLVVPGAWRQPPRFIMQAEARAVHLAYLALEPHIANPTVHVYEDNTSVGYSLRKRLTKSTALAVELQAIDRVERKMRIRATYTYVPSAKNPADAPSRGRPLSEFDWAKGYDLRRGEVESPR